MKGTIIRRGGRYSVVIELDRDPVRGRRRREWHSGYRTKRDAEAARVELLGRLQRGEYVAPSKVTFGEYLTERWLPARVGQLAPSTFESYRGNVEHHVIPAIGSARLQGLDAATLTAFYGERLHSGLSARTVRYLHAIVHKALADALSWGLVVRNVAAAAAPPSNTAAKAPPTRTWTASELATFLASIGGTRLEPLWLLYATTGLRRGEALGLTWRDLDLDARTVAIAKARVSTERGVVDSSPKSGRGRGVALDEGTVIALRAHRKRQAAEKLALGPGYDERGYVFCREDGVPYSPDYVTRAFRKAVKRSKVPQIRLHDLRHGWASLALAAGVNPKVVSERLGHTTVGFTLDRYSHVMPGLQEDAAAKVAALIANSP
jgi:integrase